jgi:transcriptional regulator with XRE-family HTH domain
MQKTTEMLINEIKTTDSIDSFISENTEEIKELSLSEYLRKLLQKYDLEKSDVFKRAGMADSNYGYELFRNDEKKASRDKLIRICIGFPLNVEETQKVLQYGKVRPLYPRDERDAYILFGLNKKYTLDELNDLLYEHNLEIFD